MKSRVVLVLSAIAVLLSGLTFTSIAQDGPTPEEMAAGATDTRKAAFKLLYFNLIPVAGMARGAPFDAEVAELNARRIADIAPMIPDLFAAMDTREFDVETEALDKIWDNQDDFSAKAMELVSAANTFADIAAAGDQRATLGAFRNLGGACANCHDDYRVDND